MTQVLDISEVVVTDQVLRALHAGQTEVRVDPGAIVTPSGWDFLRFHRVHLTRGPATAAAPSQQPVAPAAAATTGPAAISEVLPPGSEAGVLSRGRCDHPDRSYGCRTEEFGSGFVEPASCGACAIQQAGAKSCGCGGCNKAASSDDATEILVQTLTDEIMRRLENS